MTAAGPPSLIDPADGFRDAMAANRLIPPREIIADGKIHRCDANRKGGRGDGWYIMFPDAPPAGAYGDWPDGEDGWHKWCARDNQSLSTEERKAFRLRMEAARRAREVETQKLHAAAAALTESTWEQSAQVFEDCPAYLEDKRVKSHGLRVTTRDYDFPCASGGTMHVGAGALVVPVRDADGKLTSLQFIDTEGKRFLPGGRTLGRLHVIGDIEAARCVGIAEGYATGATIHEETGMPVVVAFYAGNLQPVAEAMRAKYQQARFVFGADDDHLREKNPGVTKATEAAKKVGGIVAIPDFGASRGEKDTDWNDLAKAQGPGAVKAQFERAIAAASLRLASAMVADLFGKPLPPAIVTRYPQLNEQLGGGLRGVAIVAGPTGMGKTSFALGIGCDAAETRPVLYLSTELDERQAIARVAAQRMGRAWLPLYESSDADTQAQIAAAVASLRLYVATVRDVAALTKALADLAACESEPALVVLDYLQGLSRQAEDRRLAVGAVSELLMSWTRNTGGVILAVSSIARAQYFGADDKSATEHVGAAKESGDIEYDAAAVLRLDVPAPPLGGASEGRLHIAKGRFGGPGTIGLFFDGPSGTFQADPSGGLTVDQRLVLEAIEGGARSGNSIAKEAGIRRGKVESCLRVLRARNLTDLHNNLTGNLPKKARQNGQNGAALPGNTLEPFPDPETVGVSPTEKVFPAVGKQAVSSVTVSAPLRGGTGNTGNLLSLPLGGNPESEDIR